MVFRRSCAKAPIGAMQTPRSLSIVKCDFGRFTTMLSRPLVYWTLIRYTSVHSLGTCILAGHPLAYAMLLVKTTYFPSRLIFARGELQ